MVFIWGLIVLGATLFSDFGDRGFTYHFTHVLSPEVAKDLSGFRGRNLPQRFQKNSFVRDGLSVGCTRRKLKVCGEQSLFSVRPAFNNCWDVPVFIPGVTSSSVIP
ncbi:hypothetical protein SAMN06265222_1123 [Neorhodopirellula lusitana]|uniref:Uncharacterized protein n=1 Tax=Neorhodopirellula lusitana TaxID=445327 RepID=A0ABY1QFI0_9BACT|nr:hypothetical protein SAMN06265222_1123 [Neorhodopirellula lusitana]